MNNVLQREFNRLPNSHRVINYRLRHMDSMSGWLRDEALLVTSVLAGQQLNSSVTGSVVEIGVHHGKFLCFLGLLARDDESVVGFDLFEAQEQNVDGSGHGSRCHALRNVAEVGLKAGAVRLVSSNSLALSANDVLDACRGQRCRLFSVDGGHASETTYKDLETAHGSLVKGGIVIVDDYFNQGWPGVSEGTLRFCLARGEVCIPIAIGGNKVWFTNDADKARDYVSALRLRLADVSSKNARFLGHEIFVLENLKTPFEMLVCKFGRRFNLLLRG